MPAAPAASPVVEVALPVPVDSLFDYRVPRALEDQAEPGRRVLVPFGSRRLTGVIVARRDATREPAGHTLRPLERVLDPSPVLSAAMLDMLRDAAEESFCPPGIALAAALPPGSAPRPERQVALTPRGHEALRRGAASASARELLAALADGPRSRRTLARRFPRAAARLATLQRDGLVLWAERERAPAARAATLRVVELAPGVEPRSARAGPLARAPRQAELLDQVAAHGPLELGVLRARFPQAAARLRPLLARGLVRIATRPAPREAPIALPPPEREPELTPEQESALAAIVESIHSRRFERFLLHGVTGSGKTEVYLRAIAEVLRLERRALVLVPEISLTHQLVARLRARFGDRLAVLHSALRPNERLAEWRRLRDGSTPIAVGARSALFAPLDDIGLVVIDEEQDPAYKNEEGFRYHARDLARHRAARARCPLVFGSATPSLEVRFAADRGELQRLVLPHRIGGRPLPAVELVDLGRERALLPRGRKLVLSNPLRRALRETLAQGGQAILFLNRRGFSTRIFCFDCGHAERCRHCDISLVFHAREQRLRCHYCDFSIDPPEACSNCGAGPTALLGLGTERLEEEMRVLFPDARLARLDRDTAARRGSVERTLAELAEGRLDVLIGTQMVAMGHDFPGVRLVGVVAADMGLHLPDFRAAERTFQLLTQVAGRAGRGTAPGRVVVQSFVPDHYAIRPVLEHDYEAFYREELGHRAALSYPPFGRLLHVVVSAREADPAAREAERLAQRARDVAGEGAAPTGGPPGLEVLGPAPAPIARLRDRFRFQLLVKGTDAKRVLDVGRALAREAGRAGAALRVQVDPNPVHML